MKKILILLLFCGFWANAQQYHDKGAKFEFATNEGDTITVNTRIPIIDEFGLINYYVDVADLLALNPAPVLEWGNITGTLSNQTDLQGALNNKADQSDLTAHTSNGNIHFTQSAINITESQVSDLKDYLRGDVNDTNGANKLTLGSLEVAGQTTLQNGLNLTSIPVGTSDNILTLNQTTGDVEQRVFSLGDIDIANAAGVSQFPVGLGDQLRIQGSGDTSISFDGVTNTININSTPGSGGGGAVTSFNGRDGAVVSQAGDYSTAMVNENTNLYFTEPRVRATPLTGLTVTNTPISSTNTFLQALGRLQGQINNREVSFSKNTAFNKNFGTSAGTVAQGNHTHTTSDITNLSSYTGFDSRYYTETEADGAFLHSTVSDIKTNGYTRFIPAVQWGENAEVNTNYMSGDNQWRLDFPTNAFVRWRNSGFGDAFTMDISNGNFYASGTGTFGGDVEVPNNSWYMGGSTRLLRSTNSGWVNIGDTPPTITLYAQNEVRLKNFTPITDDSGYQYMNMTSGGFLRIGYGNPGAVTIFGGSSPRYNNGTNNYDLYHAGNLRSDSQNDSRYVNNTGSETMTGYLRFTDNTALQFGSDNDSQLSYGSTNDDFRLDGGKIFKIRTAGFGTAFEFNPSTGNMFASGTITATGDVIANSDKRLKKNIKRIDNALAIVQLLGGYEYDRKDVDLHQAGVIAQEVEEVFPTAVSEDEKGIKSVAYNQLIALLIEAIKEQQIEIEQLKTLINEK